MTTHHCLDFDCPECGGKPETPYVISHSGKIHVASCGVGGHGRPIPLIELQQRIPKTGFTVPVTALCCGASPGTWLEMRYPSVPCDFADAEVLGAEATADYCYTHQAFCKDGDQSKETP